MMYLHVLGLLILTVERIFAENTMQDSLGIHLQMSFAKNLFYVINCHLILPFHLLVQLRSST